MNEKVIYVSWMPLTKKVSNDWYIDYLISKDQTVEYWDVSYLLRGELNQTRTINPCYLYTIRTYREVKKKLQLPENRDTLFVMLISYDGMRASFYRLFSKKSCRMLYIRWGSQPTISVSKSQKIISRLLNPFSLIVDIYYLIKGRLYQKLNLVRPFEIVFAAGQNSMKNNYSNKVVPINLCDFENHRKAFLESKRLVDGMYAVYLDVYLPFQSDLEMHGMHPLTAELYFASLNHFFQLIEEKYKLKVVIAAHPKADYHSDVFNGREVIYGCTPDLVKDSECVIAEMSTAISYVVMDYKPVFFVHNDEMNNIYENSVMNDIRAIAESLGEPVYNSDRLKDCSQINDPKISKELYDNYKYLYITSPESENVESSEIFHSEITGLFTTINNTHYEKAN